MLHLLLLAVHALPAFVSYREQIVPIDYEAGKLAVGTREDYVTKVTDAARWNGLESVHTVHGAHTITGWRASKSGHGLYVTNITDGKLHRTYLPGIDNLLNQKEIEATLDDLVGMYHEISGRPGMKTGQIVDLIVPKPIQDVLEKENQTPDQIIATLPALSLTMRALEKTALYGSANHNRLQSKQVAETEQYEKIQTTSAKLCDTVSTFLTTAVAQAIEPSDIIAIKAFLELMLEHYHDYDSTVDFDQIILRIRTLNMLDLDLDLSGIGADEQINIAQLLEFFKFINPLTSSETLTTIQNVNTFVTMAKSFISGSNQSASNQKDWTNTVFQIFPDFQHDFELAEITALADVDKATSPNFVAQWSQLIECVARNNRQESKRFLEAPHNSTFVEHATSIIAQKKDEISGSRTFVAAMIAKNDKNKEAWKALLDLLPPAKAERDQAYTSALERVINEMKRRFDEAVQKEARQPKSAPDPSQPSGLMYPSQQTLTEELRDAAQEIWSPGLGAEARQAAIRAISPAAAQQLEKMATTV